MQHTPEHWTTLSIASQLGNVGSEYSRAVLNHHKNQARFEAARTRFLELLDLTISDVRWNVYRKKELLRLREVSCENFPEDLQKYFDQFALLVRR
jgi:hypothetical protein